jgi:hypothetical protein
MVGCQSHKHGGHCAAINEDVLGQRSGKSLFSRADCMNIGRVYDWGVKVPRRESQFVEHLLKP